MHKTQKHDGVSTLIRTTPVSSGRKSQDWRFRLSCSVSPFALRQLLRDEPGKRRKAYLEFDVLDVKLILQDLQSMGFDLKSLKHLRPVQCNDSAAPKGLCCLVTGNVKSILRLLLKSRSVIHASVDLSEYSRLSAVR